jgi:uncharacterized repeat protein (TIGR01451 family)
MRIPILLALLAAVCAAPWAAAQVSPALGSAVDVKIEMYLVETLDGAEHFTQSLTARRGQVVEYRIFAVNRGAAELQAGTVEVYCPLPDGVVFVEYSATPNSDRVLIEYSVDGEEFSIAPLLVAQGEARVVITPDGYRGIRWTLLEPMAVGQEEVFTFRVTVE